MRLLAIALLAACADPTTPGSSGGAAGSGEDTAPVAEDTDPGAVEVERPPPGLAADDVASALTSTFAAGIPEPTLPRRQYLSVFDHRDERCPGGQGVNLPGHFAGCHAESGWIYAGLAEYTGAREVDVLDDFHLLADFTVTDAAGRPFVGGGELDFDLERSGQGLTWTGRVAGTWSWAAADAWMLPEGAGAMLDLTVTQESGWTVSLDGTVTDGTHATRLDDVTGASNTCGGAPTGRFGLRGEGGYWYWLDADCGCGPVTFDGAADGPLGEACVDLDLAALTEVVR